MHESIKSFSEEGFINDDKNFIRHRDEMERILIESMKYKGYLPVHDMGSHWTTSWLGDKYFFKVTVYGAYVGKKKAQQYMFLHNGRLVLDGRCIR